MISIKALGDSTTPMQQLSDKNHCKQDSTITSGARKLVVFILADCYQNGWDSLSIRYTMTKSAFAAILRLNKTNELNFPSSPI